MWVAATDLPTAASHPFYTRLNQLLREHRFDDFAEAQCNTFYAETMGRPSLPPGIYFRLLLMATSRASTRSAVSQWRAADSFALRDFLLAARGASVSESDDDHSTASTRITENSPGSSSLSAHDCVR
jgi:transposase